VNRKTLILGGAAALAGCGGGSRVSFKPGRAVFTVEWPKSTTRLIPAASNSVAVEVRQGTMLLERRVLIRPATIAAFDNLPEGDLTALASAYPSRDGTGVAQASGTVSLPIRDGETTQVPLTMNSTIASFTLSPGTLGVGETRRILATPKDSSGATILLPAAQLRLEVVDGASNLTWNPVYLNGTGVMAGIVTFLVTDTESGLSARATLDVGPAAPPPPACTTLAIESLTPGVPDVRIAIDSVNYLIWYLAPTSATVPDPFVEIRAMDPDTGAIVRRITTNLLSSGIDDIQLSPDSKRLYVSAGRIFYYDLASGVSTNVSNYRGMSIVSILPNSAYTPVVKSGTTAYVLNSSGIILPGSTLSTAAISSQEGNFLYNSHPTASPFIQSYSVSTTQGLTLLSSNGTDTIVYGRDGYAYRFNSAKQGKILRGDTLEEIGPLGSTTQPHIGALVGNERDRFVYDLRVLPADLNTYVVKYEGVPLQEMSLTLFPRPVGSTVFGFYSLGQNRVALGFLESSRRLGILICNGS
jgi:hypothetical protein